MDCAAFALLIATQFLAVIIVHNARYESDDSSGTAEASSDLRCRYVWQLGGWGT